MAGMRVEAIQTERDVIGKRNKAESDKEGTLLQILLRSENHCQQLRGCVIKCTEQVIYDTGVNSNSKGLVGGGEDESNNLASVNDVGKSIHQQLLITVEWAKTLPPFKGLKLSDQATLLKANAAPLLVFVVAYRSLHMDDAICLANDTVVTKDHAVNIGDVNRVVRRIIDEIIRPMRSLNIENSEYVALKAIILFDPAGRDPSTADVIAEARESFLKVLQLQCRSDECRTGMLLLLLPKIYVIAQQLIEDVHLASIFRLANVDKLMQELMLFDQPSTIIDQLSNPMIHIKQNIE